ncbi:MAG: lactate utilization protein [Clostridiaceae bacterium]|jgi:L-lactate utilization protein LutB|nr:lactate utilization protein [Bacillota bacterium]NLI38098.1 lactate utilization protein [Clostridiaceae bacterium]
MDKHLKAVMMKRIERTMENLRKNRMQAWYVESREEVVPLLETLIKDGDTVACGGSVTLFETGVIDHLRSGRYIFYDRYEKGLTPDQITEVFRKSFSVNAYLTSTNAVTENGELFNVDGRGNRVAAMIYGPDNVIVITGRNKIVTDLEEAINRLEQIAAPANAARLSRKTPCVETGFCQDCKSPDRICSSYVISRQQLVPDRIKVVIVGEELGY